MNAGEGQGPLGQVGGDDLLAVRPQVERLDPAAGPEVERPAHAAPRRPLGDGRRGRPDAEDVVGRQGLAAGDLGLVGDDPPVVLVVAVGTQVARRPGLATRHLDQPEGGRSRSGQRRQGAVEVGGGDGHTEGEARGPGPLPGRGRNGWRDPRGGAARGAARRRPPGRWPRGPRPRCSRRAARSLRRAATSAVSTRGGGGTGHTVCREPAPPCPASTPEERSVLAGAALLCVETGGRVRPGSAPRRPPCGPGRARLSSSAPVTTGLLLRSRAELVVVEGLLVEVVVVATDREVARPGDGHRGHDDDQRDGGDAVAEERVRAVAQGEHDDGRGDEHRDEVHDLDQRVDGRAGGVLEGVADRVADDRGLVGGGALAAVVAVLDDLLRVVPRAAAVREEHGHEAPGADGAGEEAGQGADAETEADDDRRRGRRGDPASRARGASRGCRCRRRGRTRASRCSP